MPDLDWSDMPIHQTIKGDWSTSEILIEGSLGCGKTTVGLDKEIDALLKWPGIPSLLFRWTEDAVGTKLRPAFEEILSIRGITATWDAKQKVYSLENGSQAYMFGLKAVSLVEQYNKIRGLGVCRIFGDQAEEMAQDVAGELRGRMRPNLTATVSGRRFPFQLTLVNNPEDEDFWLSKEFPLDNHIKGRKVYSLSIFDNAKLPAASVDSLLRQFPPEHPKNLTMVMGRRGPNITGTPVFEGQYRKEIHQRRVAFTDAPILESFEVGKHNPTWVFGQRRHAGGLVLLGGIRAQEMALEDFLPLVRDYRRDWFPAGLKVQSCIAPMGDKTNTATSRYTALEIIRRAIGPLSYRPNGNAPDVRLALIETISGYLRRRSPSGEEAFALTDDPARWLIATRDAVRESAFLHIALEAGYTWNKHFVSVSNKEVRQPQEDDKFANAMHCVENIVLNFCAGRPSQEALDLKRAEMAQQLAGGTGAYMDSPNAWLY